MLMPLINIWDIVLPGEKRKDKDKYKYKYKYKSEYEYKYKDKKTFAITQPLAYAYATGQCLRHGLTNWKKWKDK